MNKTIFTASLFLSLLFSYLYFFKKKIIDDENITENFSWSDFAMSDLDKELRLTPNNKRKLSLFVKTILQPMQYLTDATLDVVEMEPDMSKFTLETPEFSSSQLLEFVLKVKNSGIDYEELIYVEGNPGELLLMIKNNPRKNSHKTVSVTLNHQSKEWVVEQL